MTLAAKKTVPPAKKTTSPAKKVTPSFKKVTQPAKTQPSKKIDPVPCPSVDSRKRKKATEYRNEGEDKSSDSSGSEFTPSLPASKKKKAVEVIPLSFGAKRVSTPGTSVIETGSEAESGTFATAEVDVPGVEDSQEEEIVSYYYF